MSGTGREGQIGFAEESTFNTPVTVTRFFELLNESIKFDIERIESNGMRAGTKVQNLWVPGRQGGSGDIEFEVQPNGFAILTKHMLGGTPVTTTPGGGTISRLHTTKVGNLDGKSLTIQVGRANPSTVDAFTYAGCKISGWEMTLETGGVLTMKLSIDCASESTVIALATASYPTTNVMLSSYDSGVLVSVGGTPYAAKKFTLQGGNMVKGDRYKLGQAAKLEQLEGTDFREYTGTIEMEMNQGLTPYNLFKNGTEAAIVATSTGAIIEAALPYMVRCSLARARFDGETVTTPGPDILTQTIPFKVLKTSSANTEVMFETQNTDTAP
jgi:hypothetical protein